MSLVTSSTRLIDVLKNQYPVYLSQVRANHSNVAFANTPIEDSLINIDESVPEAQKFHYAVVKNTPAPNGDVVTEGNPELTEEGWVQTWDVRSFNDAEISDRLNQKIQGSFDSIKTMQRNSLEKGASYVFPSGDTEHIQLRDGDRANISGLHSMAMKLKDQGVTDPVLSFRTYEDNAQALTPAQMIDLCDFAFVAYNSIMQEVWYYKDLIKTTKTLDDIIEIPVIINYPSTAD